MPHREVKPGDIVVTTFGSYQHWSLVSDRCCDQGRPLLISATRRTGTVQEEGWHTVTEGKATYPADVVYNAPVAEVLQRARSQISIWDYSVHKRNCEHFVNWATGLKMSSKQVEHLLEGAVLGASLASAAQKLLNNKADSGLAAVAGALAGAGLGLWAARAEKKSNGEDHTHHADDRPAFAERIQLSAATVPLSPLATAEQKQRPTKKASAK